ncbi:Gzf3p [Dishui Lake large algae virus 1]|nr:Gzf3p [Dishui Lake large algae virus 1]
MTATNSSTTEKTSDYSAGDEESVFYGAESLICLSRNTSFNKLVFEKKEHKNNKETKDVNCNKCCQICLTKSTPLWRRSEEFHTLCNACGIRVRCNKQRKIKPNSVNLVTSI